MTPLKFLPAAHREEDATAGCYADQDLNAAINILEEVEAGYIRIATQPKQFPR